jgi:hypothetical protein
MLVIILPVALETIEILRSSCIYQWFIRVVLEELNKTRILNAKDDSQLTDCAAFLLHAP